MKMIDVNAVFVREEAKQFSCTSSTLLTSLHKNYCGQQEIICYVPMGALPTKVSTYVELITSVFLQNQPEIKTKKLLNRHSE